MAFSRPEYWSGVPFPPPGHLPDPEIGPGSPGWQADYLLSEHFEALNKSEGEGFAEKEMATHSSVLAWRIPWTEGLVAYSPQGHKELDTTSHTHTIASKNHPGFSFFRGRSLVHPGPSLSRPG